jgi:beta-phosphoglucomutase
MMLKAVIFDFDGVVSDSETLHYKALNETFVKYGLDVPKEVHWQKYLGYSDIENIKAVSGDYGMGFTNDQVVEIARQKTELFDKLVETETTIIDGVAEFIDMLIENNIPLAICSGAIASDIKLMLADCQFANVFKVIVTAEDVTRGKPDPEGFLLALKKLNESAGRGQILPQECIVIEDSGWGLAAARAAGMHTVAVTNTYPAEKLANLADMIAGRLDELTMEDLGRLCAN